MSFFSRYLTVFGAVAGAIFLMSLYSMLRQLVFGEFSVTEVPLVWWGDITAQNDFSRTWDPLWAGLWILVPTLFYLNRTDLDDLEYAPIFGLAAAVGYYLVFWGQPGLITWVLLVPAAMITGRISDLINQQRAAKDGNRLLGHYGITHFLGFTLNFGFGLLLPLAFEQGFIMAGLVWCLYATLATMLCLIAFIPFWLYRLTAWSWQKIA